MTIDEIVMEFHVRFSVENIGGIKSIDEFLRQSLKNYGESVREEDLRIMKDLKGYHCDTPNCDHNLDQAIAAINSINTKEE